MSAQQRRLSQLAKAALLALVIALLITLPFTVTRTGDDASTYGYAYTGPKSWSEVDLRKAGEKVYSWGGWYPNGEGEGRGKGKDEGEDVHGSDGGRGARCGMCDVAPDLCAEIGRDKVERALSFAGNNKRLRRAFRKMRTGEPWVMGVIGGSGTWIVYALSSTQSVAFNPRARGMRAALDDR